MVFARVTGFEQLAQLMITGVSNCFMLPAAFKAWSSGLYFDAIVGAFAISTSTVYHTLETLNTTFLGGDSLRFHQADNVFSVALFCFFAIQFAQIESPAVTDGLKLVILGISVCVQCIAPWNPWYSFVPIMTVCCGVISYLLIQRKLPEICKRNFRIAAVTFTFSISSFIVGLHDDYDYLRIFHGLWHFFVSIFGYTIIAALNPPHMVANRKLFYQMGAKLNRESQFNNNDELDV